MDQFSMSTLGKYIVGLQPDDRMPHDWLRMVARVFAAYREVPLEQSIVAYIDGLELSLKSFVDPMVTIAVSPGQAFVDDQFIGFEQESDLRFNINYLQQDLEKRYWVVLQYRWINMSPPREPHLYLIYNDFDNPSDPANGYNSQEMLILGYVVRRQNDIDIIDEKKPWYEELFKKMTGDAEVDDKSQLPYAGVINEDGSENPGITYEVPREGTMDIGWALDFHHVLGNNVDYNVRLHTVDGDNTNIYINDRTIISQTNGPNVYQIMIATDDATGLTSGSRICSDYATKNSSWQNFSDGGAPDTTVINDLTLTGAVDEATLNGYPLLHRGNTFKSGVSIYFVGKYDVEPTTRIEPQPDGTINTPPLEDGDIYFNTNTHTYAFYRKDGANGDWITFGESIVVSREIVNPQDPKVIPVKHRTDRPVFVWVGGILLSNDEYDATINTDNIYLIDREIQENEVVKVMAFSDEQSTMSLANPFASGNVTPVGTIIENASNEAPTGYLECNGDTYNINDYPELFTVIGTAYGDEGEGTFKVPDVQPAPFKKYIKY